MFARDMQVPPCAFLLLVLALTALPAPAQEPPPLQTILKRYLGAQTYCDTGKTGTRLEGKEPFTEEAFARCARRDGRFKYIEHPDSPARMINWSDGARHYRFSERAAFYQEHSLDDPYLYGLYSNRGEIFAVFVLRPLADARRLVDPAERARYLGAYRANSRLSTPQHTVYERSDDPHERNAERLWVLNASQSIVRYERLHDQAVLRFTEIASQEIDRPLADAELSHKAPLFTRYSAQNNLPVFVAGLLGASLLAGALAWSWLFARAAQREQVLAKRRRLWRLQLWTFGGLAAALAALAVAAMIGPDSGHPPAIVIVILLAFWCAVAFGATACFTVASYLVQPLFRARPREVP